VVGQPALAIVDFLIVDIGFPPMVDMVGY